jgi:hypothetical protein
MTNYIIRFAPELDVDGAEFVQAWNQHQPAASLAQATLPDERSRDAGMMSQMVIFLGGIATGVATNALYDGIKELVARLTKKSQIVYEVYETQQADGTKVLQVVMKPTKK